MTGWWRRNGAALITVAVLVPVTYAAVGLHETSERGGASQDVVVPPGESIEYAQAVVGPARAEFIADDVAPQGTRVVRVTVEVEPDPTAPIACLTPQLRELGGLQRSWDERSYELGRGFDEDLTNCASDETGRYSLGLEYVVPDDAAGPFTVDVDAAEGWPVLARLRVEP